MKRFCLNEGCVIKNGEYRIIRTLGQGGFGITYEAEQISLGRKVAIKEFFMKEYCSRDAGNSHVTIPSEGSRELVDRFRSKFVKEARMIASLNHPNIVRIHDVFEENGTAYHVMEHLPGGSLKEYIENSGALTAEDAEKCIREICSALVYIHSQNILHLDIKPSNILFDKSGSAVLIDFGISKHYDESGGQTSTTPTGVSKGFAPLEQYQQGDVSCFSPATDIYSLGATLYNMVTGTVPPDANIVNEDGLPELDSKIPLNFRNAILHSMQPRRKDRPQSIQEFLSLLEGIGGIADDTIVDEKPKPTESKTPHVSGPILSPVPEPRNKKRNGLPKWLYGVIAALLFVGVIAYFVLPKSKQDSTSTPQPGTSRQIETIELTSISIDRTSLALDEGASYTLTVKYTPSDATDKSITWKSTDTKVATVSSSGRVTAVKAGSAAIIASSGGKEAYCNVTVNTKPQPVQQPANNSTNSSSVIQSSTNSSTGITNGHEWVDLGLSVKWATCNVGASDPEGYGDYYAWGETSTKSSYTWSTYKYCNGSYDIMTKYCNKRGFGYNGFTDYKITLEQSDDVARVKWGGSWRMPTDSEFEELLNNCTWTWTTQNGIPGYKVTSKKSGYTSRSIFLPAAGYRYDTGLSNVGSIGYYWSSSLTTGSPSGAEGVRFNSSDVVAGISSRRGEGQSVRPVCP